MLLAPDKSYELHGINDVNIDQITFADTCGTLSLVDNSTAVITTTHNICNFQVGVGCNPCALTIYGISLAVNTITPNLFSEIALSIITPSQNQGQVGALISPIELPPITNFVNLASAQNCIYNFNPALPSGLKLSGTNIVGIPMVGEWYVRRRFNLPRFQHWS